MRNILTGLLLCLILLTNQPPLPIWAAPQLEPQPPALQVQPVDDQLHIIWQVPGATSATADLSTQAIQTALQPLPKQRYGGHWLPMHFQTVRLTTDEPVALAITALRTQPWPLDLEPSAPLPPPLDGAVRILARGTEAATLPTSPIIVLREGRIRGHRVAVVAVSPLYADEEGVKVATAVSAALPGTPLSDAELVDLVTARPLHAGLTPPPSPGNAAAFRPAVRIQVSQAGMQQFQGSALLAAGLPAEADLTKLHLLYRGQPVALQISDSDGRLDSTTQIRFYAPHPAHREEMGERWNSTDTYWLIEEAGAGLRMDERTVTPGDAPLRTTAIQTGIWEDNQLYESQMAGMDGDHWFARALQAAPVQSSAALTDTLVTLVLNRGLPPADALTTPTVYTITGSTRTLGRHQLRFNFGQVQQSFTWTTTNYAEDWQTTHVVSATPDAIQAVMPASQRPLEVRIDKVHWRRPVSLNFGGQSAAFSGVEGRWRYGLTNLPSTGDLYDVSDPLRPQHLTPPWATQLILEDGPAARDYLVAGPDALATPTLRAHTPITLAMIGGADVVYLAAAHFHDELAPLLARRQQQGYRAIALDPQVIYDGWSFGQVSPEAIRAFLRYAVYYWNPAPIAAVLVGDATTDPRNYLGMNNPNILPPYMARVDPWLGEAPCENCFGQLDDELPVGGPTDPDFLPDLWIGRFSVQTEEDLTKIVTKIVAYETTDLLTPEPTFSLYVADNYIQPNGSKDEAGDFAQLLDTVLAGDSSRNLPASQSPALSAVRVYYDPRPEGVTDPWREPDAIRARERVIEHFKARPSLVVYTGHANHFQWASTVRTLPQPYLFGTNDIYELHNYERLPIVLEMTCLTAQFTFLSATGTTIDERFQRHSDGGAAAIWGSAGLTVSYGHREMLRGFHKRLWQLPPLTARMGDLVTAGYLELFTNEVCCQESRHVYLLLGDPLTPARVWAPHLYLPVVEHQ
jgi:hypothetical protein